MKTISTTLQMDARMLTKGYFIISWRIYPYGVAQADKLLTPANVVWC